VNPPTTFSILTETFDIAHTKARSVHSYASKIASKILAYIAESVLNGYNDGMTYDIKFREKVLKHMRENELKPKEVSVLFSIGLNTVRRWLKNITPKVCKRKPWKVRHGEAESGHRGISRWVSI
jgi:hypothetical protein